MVTFLDRVTGWFRRRIDDRIEANDKLDLVLEGIAKLETKMNRIELILQIPPEGEKGSGS
jgi:hypothetical protein